MFNVLAVCELDTDFVAGIDRGNFSLASVPKCSLVAASIVTLIDERVERVGGRIGGELDRVV